RRAFRGSEPAGCRRRESAFNIGNSSAQDRGDASRSRFGGGTGMKKLRSERIAFTCSAFLLLALLVPTGAYAQFGGLFSAILGTITGPVGGALSDINRVRSEVLQTEQQALWPAALIEETRNYIAAIKASYRGWMNSVFAIRVNSAILPASRSFESEFLSAQSGQIPDINQSYATEY